MSTRTIALSGHSALLRTLVTPGILDIVTGQQGGPTAREIGEWEMRCTCPLIDVCTCGVHPLKVC